MKFVESLGIFCNIANSPFYPWIFVTPLGQMKGDFLAINRYPFLCLSDR